MVSIVPITFLLWCLIPALCLFAQNSNAVSSIDLITRAAEFDGKTVTFRGEIVGDILKRGDYSWINLNDGANAVGVFIPTTETVKIQFVGDYKFKGDIIEVTGEFHRACARHGGDLDIHAARINIIEPGHRIPHPVNKRQVLIAVILSAVALILFLINKKIKKVRSDF